MTANFLAYFCNEFDSVFDSQVLELILSISRKNIFKKTYLFLGVRDEVQKKKFLERKISGEIELVFYRSYPNYSPFNYFLRKELSKAIKKSNLNPDESIFHTRGELLSWHLSKILDKKYYNSIVPDVRGATLEETLEFQNFNPVMRYFKIWNKKKALESLRKFKSISVVSKTLKKYLIENHGVNPDNIFITPCLSGNNFNFNYEQRSRIRKELNLSDKDKLIVFSSGSSAGWQNNEVLNGLGDKEMKILNLARKEISNKNVINKFISYNEMPLYLSAADVAIIWRNESIVNKVASPVKFSEYLCCGLPVIANDTIDMVQNIIRENKVGMVLDNIDDLNEEVISEMLDIDRQHISNVGKKNFGLESIVESYQSLYYNINIAERFRKKRSASFIKINVRRIFSFLISGTIKYSGILELRTRFILKNKIPLALYFHNPSKELFEEVITWLMKKGFRFLSLSKFLYNLQNNISTEGAVWISFDDGYEDNISNVLPVINNYKIPATFFIATKPVEEGFFWWDLANKYSEKSFNDVSNLWEIPNEERVRIISKLKKERILIPKRPITPQGLMKLSSNPLVTIGNHTDDHAISVNCGVEELKKEIRLCEEKLSRWVGNNYVNVFSYPNGDYNDTVRCIVMENNMAAAFTNEPRPVAEKDDIFLIPRLGIVDELSVSENILHAVGIWQPIVTRLRKLTGLSWR